MNERQESPAIRVGHGPDGSLTYLVDLPPEELPPVLGRDLERAWYAARDAALAQQWGVVRGFRFHRPDGTHTDLALADSDARCWASAVEMNTSRGLSLFLRLLALVELLAGANWARPLCRLARDGAELHPALLRTAATLPLTAEARFDESRFRLRLSQFVAGFQLTESTPSPAARLRHAPAQELN
jgi:hypothetical protein